MSIRHLASKNLLLIVGQSGRQSQYLFLGLSVTFRLPTRMDLWMMPQWAEGLPQEEVTVLTRLRLRLGQLSVLANINVYVQLLAANFSGFGELCTNQVPKTVA